MHGCTLVSPGHRETSESTQNCQSLFSCPIASICLPQDGISLHTQICSYMQAHTHSELHGWVMSCSARVELLVLLPLINRPINMFMYVASSWLHGLFSVVNSCSSLFPLRLFSFRFHPPYTDELHQHHHEI